MTAQRNQTITKIWGHYDVKRPVRGVRNPAKRRHSRLAWSSPLPVGLYGDFYPSLFKKDTWCAEYGEHRSEVWLQYQNRSGLHYYRLGCDAMTTTSTPSYTKWMQADDITAVWVTAKITGELWQ